MGRAAKPKAVGKQTSPILATPQVAFCEASAPQVLRALFAVRVMGVPPEPGSQCLVLLGVSFPASCAAVLLSLRREEPVEARTSQSPWIPWMVGPNLWIAHVCSHRCE